MNKEEQFDHLLRDKLSNINPTMPSNAWEKFSRYSQMQAFKDGNVFDHNIKSKMGSISRAAAPGSWEAFKSHWDEKMAADSTKFDTQVKQKLSNISQIPNDKAQQVFDSALKTVAEQKRILVSNLLEISLLGILLLLLLVWLPNSNTSILPESKQDSRTPIQVVKPESFAPASNNENETPAPVDSSEPAETITHQDGQKPMAYSNTNTTASPVSQTSTAHATQSHSANTIAGSISGKSSKHTMSSAGVSGTGGDGRIPANAAPIADNASSNAKSLFMLDSNAGQNQDLNEGSTWNDNDAAMAMNMRSVYEELTTLAAASTKPKSFYHPDDYPSYNPIAIKNVKANKFISTTWIGARVGQAINFIKTPTVNDSSRDLAITSVNSTVVGLSVELKNKFVNLETGVSYTNFEIGLDQLRPDKIHLLNIPLSLKKDFYPNAKLNPYFKIGPDVNIALAASYFPDLNRKNANSNSDEKALSPGFNYLETKEEEGILKSGNFIDNSFFGVHGSIGVDWKINPLSKINVEVTQQLNPFNKGLGINNHKLSAISVNVGYKQLLF